MLKIHTNTYKSRKKLQLYWKHQHACVRATSGKFINVTFLLSISTFHFVDDEYTFTEYCQVFHLLDSLFIILIFFLLYSSFFFSLTLWIGLPYGCSDDMKITNEKLNQQGSNLMLKRFNFCLFEFCHLRWN